MRKYLEFIGALAGVTVTILFFWAMFWFLCLLEDQCYYNNFTAAI